MKSSSWEIPGPFSEHASTPRPEQLPRLARPRLTSRDRLSGRARTCANRHNTTLTTYTSALDFSAGSARGRVARGEHVKRAHAFLPRVNSKTHSLLNQPSVHVRGAPVAVIAERRDSRRSTVHPAHTHTPHREHLRIRRGVLGPYAFAVVLGPYGHRDRGVAGKHGRARVSALNAPSTGSGARIPVVYT